MENKQQKFAQKPSTCHNPRGTCNLLNVRFPILPDSYKALIQDICLNKPYKKHSYLTLPYTSAINPPSTAGPCSLPKTHEEIYRSPLICKSNGLDIATVSLTILTNHKFK